MNPTIVTSKWGTGYLYKHDIAACDWWGKPANPISYYAAEPSFTCSSSLICVNSSFTFTTNLSSIYSYVWNGCSSNLSQVPNIPGKFTATGSGPAWVKIKINNIKEVTHNFHIHDKPDLPNGIVGSDWVSPNLSTYFYVIISSPLPITGSNWYVSGGAADLSHSTGSYTYATFYDYANYYLSAVVSNACGSNSAMRSFYVYSPSPAYPNPASHIFTVEIEQHSIDRAKALQQSSGGAKSAADPVFDIRLYDGLGNMVRQASTKGGTVQFNVSGLPNGNYYLHVYDGVSSTPEIQQIMVEH